MAKSPPPALEGEVLSPESDVLTQFADFARIIGDVTAKKTRRDAALAGLGDMLDKLTAADYPELINHPVVQRLMETVSDARVESAGVPPGTEVAGLKKPWTWADIAEGKRPEPELQWVVWEPRQNMSITWNGIQLNVRDGIEIRTPRCFKDIHDESRRGMRAAEEHRAYLMKQRSDAPTDPTILGRPGEMAQGARVRGGMAGGMYIPDGGLEMTPNMQTEAGAAEQAKPAGEGEGSEQAA